MLESFYLGDDFGPPMAPTVEVSLIRYISSDTMTPPRTPSL
jgi:hypothetical protein